MPNENSLRTPKGIILKGKRVGLGKQPWPTCSRGKCLGFDPMSQEFVFGLTDPDTEPTYPLGSLKLTQRIFVFADPFGRHITKIAELRASRPQPSATYGQIV